MIPRVVKIVSKGMIKLLRQVFRSGFQKNMRTVKTLFNLVDWLRHFSGFPLVCL